MSEELLLKLADEIGPEAIVHVYDPATGMKGVLVIDSTALGPAGGGTRMLPDITTEEVFGLARGMTHKHAALGLARGGSKQGIWGDPNMPPSQKDKILRAFGRALSPYIATYQVIPGPDMGVSISDVDTIFEGAGISCPRTGLFKKEKDGEKVGDLVTGFGAIVAAQAACEFAGIDFNGAKVAIEGFGKVGGGAALTAAKAGAKVVAISTTQGAIYNDKGLDVNRLLEIKKSGGRVVAEYEGAKHLAKEELFSLPVDVLVPGARPYVLNKDNVGRVQAKIISCGANIAITPEAEDILFQRGIWSIPDFIANSGGVLTTMFDLLGGTVEQAFEAITRNLRSNTLEVLAEARK